MSSNDWLTYFSRVELLDSIPEIVENSLSKLLQTSNIRLSVTHASPTAWVAVQHHVTINTKSNLTISIC